MNKKKKVLSIITFYDYSNEIQFHCMTDFTRVLKKKYGLLHRNKMIEKEKTLN